VSFPLAPAKIARLINAPEINVATCWPVIESALAAVGIISVRACIAAIATVRVECPPFKPVHEYGGDAYLNRLYDTRTDLGNTPGKDGDGARYAGRGFIQITGQNNYRHYGVLMGLDLINKPDEALEPQCAARILAAYFRDHHIDRAADAQDWEHVRRSVNGGLNGYGDFLKYVQTLQGACDGSQVGQAAGMGA
jgi:putative chitinase